MIFFDISRVEHILLVNSCKPFQKCGFVRFFRVILAVRVLFVLAIPTLWCKLLTAPSLLIMIYNGIDFSDSTYLVNNCCIIS